MQFGKTLIGAIIGAAIGIALLVIVYMAFTIDAVWLAIPVAILTGLGVRTMVSTSGHPSYLRGATTGVLALAAYLVGWYIVAQVATQRASAAAEPRADLAAAAQPAEGAAGDSADATEGDDAKADAPKAADEPQTRPAGSNAAVARNPAMPRSFSTLDFVWLCLAGLVAYELGRGTGGAKPVAEGEETVTEVPVGNHPDA